MLSGEKVALRAPTEGDIDALYEIASDLDTWEERGPQPPRPLTRAEYEKRVIDVISAPNDNVLFVVEAAGEMVGRCDLFDADPLTRTAEVGIALRASARGRGYGTDAMRVLVRFGFERLNLRRLHLTAIASNAAGLASYRKVGFVEEGRRREHAWVRGAYEDEIVMGLLRSEWTG